MNPLEDAQLRCSAGFGGTEPRRGDHHRSGVPVVGVSSSGGGPCSRRSRRPTPPTPTPRRARLPRGRCWNATAKRGPPRSGPGRRPCSRTPAGAPADADRLARLGPSSAFGPCSAGRSARASGARRGRGRRRSGDLARRSGGFGATDAAARAPRGAPDAARGGFVRGGTSHGDTLVKRAPDGGYHPDGYGDARSSDGPEKGPGAAEKASETVADAFSAAMAKGLDLVSGKAATASSAGSGADADQASRVGGRDGGGALYASGARATLGARGVRWRTWRSTRRRCGRLRRAPTGYFSSPEATTARVSSGTARGWSATCRSGPG